MSRAGLALVYGLITVQASYVVLRLVEAVQYGTRYREAIVLGPEITYFWRILASILIALLLAPACWLLTKQFHAKLEANMRTILLALFTGVVLQGVYVP